MGSVGKSHVILIPMPAQGHLPPMIYLSRKLAREGFTVTIINIDSIHATLKETWEHAPGLDIRLESIPLEMVMPNGFDEKIISAQGLFLQAMLRMEDPLSELITRIHQQGPSVTCVVSDFFHLCAPQAAQKAGLPGAAFMPGMVAWASIELGAPQLVANGDVPVKGRAVSFQLAGVELRSQELPLYLHKADYEILGGDEIALLRAKRTSMDSWMLVNTVLDFEPETFQAVERAFGGKLITVGPLFPLAWLDRQAPESVLYISFGSISVLSFQQFKEIALGVEASNRPFLWVNRSNSVLDMDEEFYRSFCGRTKDRGLIIDWSPQLQVLQHDATGGFLTHCGWNSVFESVCGGVPMLAWPCMYEQHTNAKLMLEEKGIGLSFAKQKDGTVTSEEVQGKIKALFEEPEGKTMRERTVELQKLAQRAARPGGSSYDNLNNFFSKVAF